MDVGIPATEPTATPTLEPTTAPAPSEPVNLKTITWVAADGEGNVYVLGYLVEPANTQVVVKLNPSGKVAGPTEVLRSGDDQFTAANDFAVDGAGNIYMSETDYIKKFSPDGTFLLQWSIPAADGDHPSHPRDLAVDEAGNVFVVVNYFNGLTSNTVQGVQKFSPTGEFLLEVSQSVGS